MKSTELRLGNYFNPIDRSNQVHLPLTGFIFKVLKIGIFDVEAIQFDKHPAQVEKYDFFPTNDTSPILLSEEWLLKLGFERKYNNDKPVWVINHYMFLDFSFHISAKESGFFSFNCFLKELKYVHELQNLYFALTGDELII